MTCSPHVILCICRRERSGQTRSCVWATTLTTTTSSIYKMITDKKSVCMHPTSSLILTTLPPLGLSESLILFPRLAIPSRHIPDPQGSRQRTFLPSTKSPFSRDSHFSKTQTDQHSAPMKFHKSCLRSHFSSHCLDRQLSHGGSDIHAANTTTTTTVLLQTSSSSHKSQKG